MTNLSKTDLPTSQKIELAVFSLATQGEYGSVSSLATAFEVSRPTVYEARNTAQELLNRHFNASEPDENKHQIILDSAQLCRTIVALRAMAPNSLRAIEDLLPIIYPGLQVSYGLIQDICSEAEILAQCFNEQADLSFIRAGALDEMFSQGNPVLAGVDLDSGYLFLLSQRSGRSGADWAEELRIAKARGLELEKVVKDAGLGIKAGVEEVFAKAEQRDDCFHALYSLGKVKKQLERKAYGALSEVEELKKKLENCQNWEDDKRKRLIGKLSAATRRLNSILEKHDQFEQAYRQAQEAMEPVDVSTGKIRDAETMQAELEKAAQQMLLLDDKKIRKVGRYLKNRAPGLALHMFELSARLSKLFPVFGQQAVELSCLILRLLSELSNKRRPWLLYETRRQLGNAYRMLEEMVGQQSGVVLAEVEFWLWHRHRASSAIEGFNAALRPYLYVHKGVTDGFLELFRFYYNMRTRRWGRQKGTSPHEVLNGYKVKDWLSELGYPPSSELN